MIKLNNLEKKSSNTKTNKKIDDILEYRKTRTNCDTDVKAELYNNHHDESRLFFY